MVGETWIDPVGHIAGYQAFHGVNDDSAFLMSATRGLHPSNIPASIARFRLAPVHCGTLKPCKLPQRILHLRFGEKAEPYNIA